MKCKVQKRNYVKHFLKNSTIEESFTLVFFFTQMHEKIMQI